MNRYQQNPTLTRWDGKRVMTSTIYPTIPYNSNDLYVITSDADYLDVLSQKYYQDPSFWWVIACANGLRATMKAPSGMQLRIPANLQGIISAFSSENS
jgi:hypothetical protein